MLLCTPHLRRNSSSTSRTRPASWWLPNGGRTEFRHVRDFHPTNNIYSLLLVTEKHNIFVTGHDQKLVINKILDRYHVLLRTIIVYGYAPNVHIIQSNLFKCLHSLFWKKITAFFDIWFWTNNCKIFTISVVIIFCFSLFEYKYFLIAYILK